MRDIKKKYHWKRKKRSKIHIFSEIYYSISENEKLKGIQTHRDRWLVFIISNDEGTEKNR